MDVYAIVTEKIIDLLETGVVPWRKPWSSTGLPRNLVTQKPYRGINHFLLSASKFVSPFWLTMRQANQLGGSVRKGEPSTLVIFWKIEGGEQETSEEIEFREHSYIGRRRFVLRYYRIFNQEQCDLPQAVLDKLPTLEKHAHTPIETCAEFIGCMPNAPEIIHGGSKAFYSPATDCVTLPPVELFTSIEGYYASAYHELSHSTGHSKRLGRESITELAHFGSHEYSVEELVAEMGAAYLCAESGISPAVIDNQASYIAGWLAHLRGDSKMILRAAVHAQRAADYIMGREMNKVVKM